MTIKKKYDGITSVPIKSSLGKAEAFIQKRGKYWYFQMWLPKENRYERRSLKTQYVETAIEKAEGLLIEIRQKISKGESIGSLNCAYGVKRYLDYRRKEVSDTGEGIVINRWKTLELHLRHWLEYIGSQRKLKELDISDCLGYFDWRRQSSKKLIKANTLKNEQSTINSMMNYLKEINETNIQAFKFEKVKAIQTDRDLIRRQTFTREEYRIFYKTLRQYTAKSLKLSDDRMRYRQLIRHWLLISANSGLRSGEQRQLKWSDVELLNAKNPQTNKTERFAKISIRALTSKVRKGREFYMRSGELFDSLRVYQSHKVNDGLVFSMDGTRQLDRSLLQKEWTSIMEMTGIKDYKERGIVPYSLRHFCITERLTSGMSIQQVALMCGTSIKQIEATYYHQPQAELLTNAMRNYKIIDGLIQTN